jgi:CheY-like chemotaxis protein
VVCSEQRNVTLQGVAALGSLLPASSQLFLLVNAASSTERAARADGVCVQVVPFSPRQLLHVASLARQAGLQPSGHTEPAPLAFDNRRLALVLHDDPTQAEIVGAMLMALGHEAVFARTVDDAAAALGAEHAPEVVLLNLDAASSELRGVVGRLRAEADRRSGQRLRIIAATNEGPVDGADACIAKPLTIQKLAQSLPVRWPWA